MPKSDLKRIDRMKDEDIDYSDIPPLTDDELAGFRPLGEVFPDLVRRSKTRITIRIDDDVLAWFKACAKDADIPYQALMNQALRFIVFPRVEPTLEEEDIRASTAARAYRIWEREQRGHGRDVEHWLEAEAKAVMSRVARKIVRRIVREELAKTGK